jgi:hypothetical protein
MVPVPEDRVQDVYSLLAKGPEPAQEIEETADDELSDEWSDDEIRRAYLESTGAIRQVLVLLAQNPGQRFYSEQLYEMLEISRSQWSGVTGAFGKKVRNRYAKSTKPFIEGWDDEAGSMYYEMPEDFAEVIAAEL